MQLNLLLITLFLNDSDAISKPQVDPQFLVCYCSCRKTCLVLISGFDVLSQLSLFLSCTRLCCLYFTKLARLSS
jgi:hypothetical protein